MFCIFRQRDPDDKRFANKMSYCHRSLRRVKGLLLFRDGVGTGDQLSDLDGDAFANDRARKIPPLAQNRLGVIRGHLPGHQCAYGRRGGDQGRIPKRAPPPTTVRIQNLSHFNGCAGNSACSLLRTSKQVQRSRHGLARALHRRLVQLLQQDVLPENSLNARR